LIWITNVKNIFVWYYQNVFWLNFLVDDNARLFFVEIVCVFLYNDLVINKRVQVVDVELDVGSISQLGIVRKGVILFLFYVKAKILEILFYGDEIERIKLGLVIFMVMVIVFV